MLNTNETIFIFILMLIVAFILIGLYVLMNKINRRRQELLDIEQRITEVKEKYSLDQIKMYEPAVIRKDMNFQPNPPAGPPVMTPKKKSERKSILYKIYSFRNASTSPPLSPRKPSSIRSPSFLPIQESHPVHPPTYEDSVVSLSNQKH